MYSYAPLPDLTLTHYGWWVWFGIVITCAGPWLFNVCREWYADEISEFQGSLALGGIVLFATGLVWLGSYGHNKPENIKYTATLAGFTNTKDGMMVSYKLDKSGNIVMKEVVPGHEYPKRIVMYKNKRS